MNSSLFLAPRHARRSSGELPRLDQDVVQDCAEPNRAFSRRIRHCRCDSWGNHLLSVTGGGGGIQDTTTITAALMLSCQKLDIPTE
jgi:hypothetical protein